MDSKDCIGVGGDEICFDKELFEDEQKMSDYECGICNKVFKNPVNICDNHCAQFCSHCALAQFSCGTLSCGTCGHQSQLKDIKPCKTTQRKLGQLRMHCQYCGGGTIYSDYQHHLNNHCEHNLLVCDFFEAHKFCVGSCMECNGKMKRGKMENHKADPNVIALNAMVAHFERINAATTSNLERKIDLLNAEIASLRRQVQDESTYTQHLLKKSIKKIDREDMAPQKISRRTAETQSKPLRDSFLEVEAEDKATHSDEKMDSAPKPKRSRSASIEEPRDPIEELEMCLQRRKWMSSLEEVREQRQWSAKSSQELQMLAPVGLKIEELGALAGKQDIASLKHQLGGDGWVQFTISKDVRSLPRGETERKKEVGNRRLMFKADFSPNVQGVVEVSLTFLGKDCRQWVIIERCSGSKGIKGVYLPISVNEVMDLYHQPMVDDGEDPQPSLERREKHDAVVLISLRLFKATFDVSICREVRLKGEDTVRDFLEEAKATKPEFIATEFYAVKRGIFRRQEVTHYITTNNEVFLMLTDGVKENGKAFSTFDDAEVFLSLKSKEAPISTPTASGESDNGIMLTVPALTHNKYAATAYFPTADDVVVAPSASRLPFKKPIPIQIKKMTPPDDVTVTSSPFPAAPPPASASQLNQIVSAHEYV